MQRNKQATIVFAFALVLSACMGEVSDEGDQSTEAADSVTASAIGAPIRGLSQAQLDRFNAGKAAFVEVEEVEDGLGPVFNDSACGNCHFAGAIGGASDRTVTRFGAVRNGVFDPLEALGGSLIQANGIGAITTPDGRTCNYLAEQVPAQANVSTRRLTTPLFGLGLVDAVPDATFQSLARWQASNTPQTAGRPNLVTNVLTNQTVVGKFGWKGQNPTLPIFAADAYLNEMGITNPTFPHENCPQGNCELLACDPKADPEDDGEDVAKFADFMTMLSPPPRLPLTSDGFAGKSLFAQIGCASCHQPMLTTGTSPIAALSRVSFSPFSDFLLHDMGRLGDGISQGVANGNEIRTAPLWGLRFRPRLLHDGRATTVSDAILAHDGQGRRARDTFSILGFTQRRQLLAYLGSL